MPWLVSSVVLAAALVLARESDTTKRQHRLIVSGPELQRGERTTGVPREESGTKRSRTSIRIHGVVPWRAPEWKGTVTAPPAPATDGDSTGRADTVLIHAPKRKTSCLPGQRLARGRCRDVWRLRDPGRELIEVPARGCGPGERRDPRGHLCRTDEDPPPPTDGARLRTGQRPSG